MKEKGLFVSFCRERDRERQVNDGGDLEDRPSSRDSRDSRDSK